MSAGSGVGVTLMLVFAFCAAAASGGRQGVPAPPVATWTAAGSSVTTRAFTYCWNGPRDAAGVHMAVCADGVVPSCARGSVTKRLRAPAAGAVRVRVQLGFLPRSLKIALRPSSGRVTRPRADVRRVTTFLVPEGFEGVVDLFTKPRDASLGGDAAYGVCVERRAPS